MVLSGRSAWFLIGFGFWSWVIWPVFLKNIWADPRSWNHGMTGFFAVHLVLTVVSLALGTVIGGLGVRAWLGGRGAQPEPEPELATIHSANIGLPDGEVSVGGTPVTPGSANRR